MNVNIQSEKDDTSTDDVLSWVKHFSNNKKVNLIFDYFSIDNIALTISNLKTEYKLNGISINSYDSYWYRRGILKYEDKKLNYNLNLKDKIIKHNLTPVIDFVNLNNISAVKINKFIDNDILKLLQYKVSVELDIKIPNTYILSNKKDLEEIFHVNEKVVLKGIKYPSMEIKVNDKIIQANSKTKIITKNNFKEFPEKFIPSLFQEYVEKEFEIRSFYLDGIFKSMAIFSQQNEKTKIDFRNYDLERPNRTVTYKLPKMVEAKYDKLMRMLDINCGSFDIIYTPSGEYVFLEVNPIGQFQWLSKNCNYYLERLIAKTLTT